MMNKGGSCSGFNLMNFFTKPKHSVSQHVEMIIAFMLFVVFVMFLLVFIRPYEKTALPESVLLGLADNFEIQSRTELKSIFVKINPDADPEKCGTNNIEKTQLPVEVYNYEKVRKINEAGGSFYLIISQNIKNDYSFGACGDFSVGSIEQRGIMSFAKIQELNEQYKTSYNELRTALGVPPTIEFAVSFDESEMESVAPEDVNVVAKTVSRQVLFENGSIEVKDFIFKIW